MYYNTSNIVDYDVLDYDEFNEYVKDDILYVNVKAYVRIVKYENGKFVSKYLDDVYVMKKNNQEILDIKDEVNIIKCHNCGLTIDFTKGKCEFCSTKINYFQGWILITDK